MTGKEATKIGSTADSKQNAETVRNLLGCAFTGVLY